MRLHLDRRPQRPHAHLSVLGQVGGRQRAAVLPGEVEVDRQQLVQHQPVVVDRGDVPVRVHRQELRALRVQRRLGGLGRQPVELHDRHELERDAELVGEPDVARGARAVDAVDGQHGGEIPYVVRAASISHEGPPRGSLFAAGTCPAAAASLCGAASTPKLVVQILQTNNTWTLEETIMARVTRRKFLKVSGAGALAAKTGGMAGILATGRAPAYAQATTVHWLRWNDFVPASDQLLRKEMLPEAEKALGIKINLETVNGNDLQPRITAAIQSGAGPDLIMLFNNHPQLYAASLVDMSDVAEALGKAEGGYYPLVKSNSNDGKKWISMPWAIIGGMIAYRKSWFDEVGVTTVPRHLGEVSRGRQEAQGQGPPDRPDARPHVRRRADVHLPLHVVVGRQGGRGRRQDVVINSKETVESVKFMTGFWKDAHDEGGLAWDDTNNNRAFLSQTICGHAQRRLDLHRVAAQPRQVHHREGRAAEDRHPARAAAQGAGRPVRACTPTHSHVLPKYSKNQKAAKDFLKWVHSKASLREVVRLAEGLRHAADGGMGEAQGVGRGSGDGALQGRGPARPHARLCRPAEREGGRGALQVHHHRHVREGRAGHAGGGCREVGRGRAQEGLRLSATLRPARSRI